MQTPPWLPRLSATGSIVMAKVREPSARSACWRTPGVRLDQKLRSPVGGGTKQRARQFAGLTLQQRRKRRVRAQDSAFRIDQGDAVADGFEGRFPLQAKIADGLLGRAGTEKGRDRGEQEVWLDRLGDVAVRASFETGDLGAIVAEGRRHLEHRNQLGFAVRFDGAANLKPADIREAHVEKHEIRVLFLNESKGLGTARGFQHAVAGLAQNARLGVAGGFIIVHHQNARCRSGVAKGEAAHVESTSPLSVRTPAQFSTIPSSAQSRDISAAAEPLEKADFGSTFAPQCSSRSRIWSSS
jgi:hypothetical protein